MATSVANRDDLSYHIFGSYIEKQNQKPGVRFTVWAPHAEQVKVVGDFNGWNGSKHRMNDPDDLGNRTLFIEGLAEGTLYKYEIHTSDGQILLKADPYAFHSEFRPGTASIVASLEDYEWHDQAWLQNKAQTQLLDKPLLIYEVHLGSWRRKADGSFYNYRELASELLDYVIENGYTHIELMPLAEHPLDSSWGYQVTGYYSVTSRFGSPKDFMYFMDLCHQKGVGVILDWVPGHFCKDAHGLGRFDGTPLFEYEDERKAERPSWGTLVFDYAKPEVVRFLISNALFWMNVYHVDGLRVDAVSSMISLNFDRGESERISSEFGDMNVEAVAFLKKLNETVFASHPNALMIAEDASDWTKVTAPTYTGGLGFNYIWNLSWTWNTLEYMKKNPAERGDQEGRLTDSFQHIYAENYILPYSHDEAGKGSKSILGKMSGDDDWQKFANFRTLYGYMIGHPGKKLVFMGTEIGQMDDWNSEEPLQWSLLEHDPHRKLNRCIVDLNLLYSAEKALWEKDDEPLGFQWIDSGEPDDGLVFFARKSADEQELIVLVCNLRTELYENYRLGVSRPGTYRELFNSDSADYGGSGRGNREDLLTVEVGWQGQSHNFCMTIPPLSVVMLKHIPKE